MNKKAWTSAMISVVVFLLVCVVSLPIDYEFHNLSANGLEEQFPVQCAELRTRTVEYENRAPLLTQEYCVQQYSTLFGDRYVIVSVPYARIVFNGVPEAGSSNLLVNCGAHQFVWRDDTLVDEGMCRIENGTLEIQCDDNTAYSSPVYYYLGETEIRGATSRIDLSKLLRSITVNLSDKAEEEHWITSHLSCIDSALDPNEQTYIELHFQGEIGSWERMLPTVRSAAFDVVLQSEYINNIQ